MSETKKSHIALGLMSGTSLDGIDAALIRTDGHALIEPLAFTSRPYTEDLRDNLRACAGRTDKDEFIQRVEREMTLAHAAIVKELLSTTTHKPDLIGFHGHTILHNPNEGESHQIGNGTLLAQETGVDVICNFRSADVAAGGQGAPLIPLYHAARAGALEKPLAIVNIGGVANVTFLGRNEEILAFDTGPGNALIDDWMKTHKAQPYDKDGATAAAGTVNEEVLAEALTHPYFTKTPPKSLDRDAFGKILNDPATLTAFTVRSIAKAQEHFPQAPTQWLITGGGRHNKTIMNGVHEILNVPVESVEAVGWNGDALEAEGFAYLAVRSLRGLPLSLPTTTGVKRPQTGGVLYQAV